MYSLSTHCGQQLFFLNFLNEWKGLGYGGRVYTRVFRECLSAGTYRRYKMQHLEIVREKIKKIGTDGDFVAVVDNFDKTYSWSDYKAPNQGGVLRHLQPFTTNHWANIAISVQEFRMNMKWKIKYGNAVTPKMIQDYGVLASVTDGYDTHVKKFRLSVT